MSALGYYPGCSLTSSASEYDRSLRAVAGQLGVELREIPDWVCCGATSAHAIDHNAALCLAADTLAKARRAGLTEVLAPCAMCYQRLAVAAHELKHNPKIAAAMDEAPGLENIKPLSILGWLGNSVKLTVNRPLTGLKVACYYGCLLVRPKEVAFDDVENPTVMENLIAALGATPVPFPQKTECCGAYHTVGKPEIIADRTDKIMGSAHEEHADLVVVSCPLCAFNLDFRQADAKRLNPDFHHLPVLYFTQLMALAFGCDEAALRFDLHHIDPKPVLAGRGLA